MLFRAMNAIMAALFAFAVIVQYNDPDPLRWMLIYAAACGVSLAAALRGSARPLAAAAAAVGLVALVWGILWIMESAGSLSSYAHMFDAWEMRSAPVEEAREASGLLIVAVWMAVIAIPCYKNVRMRRK